MKMSSRIVLHVVFSASILMTTAYTSVAQESEQPNAYLVESRIYTFTTREAMTQGKGTLVFFRPKVDSSVHLGSNTTLTAGPIKITLEGGDLDIEGEDTTSLKFVAAPRLHVLEDQKAEVTVEDYAPIQYFVPAQGRQLERSKEGSVPQQSDRPTEEDPLRQAVDIDFNDLNLANVIGLLAQKGEINVVTPPHLAKGRTVTAKLKDISLGRAFEAVLRLNDLALVKRDGYYEVVSLDDAGQIQRDRTDIFVLKESDTKPSLTLSIVVLGKEDDGQLSGTAALSISVVNEREPIPGVTLDVGKPSITRLQTREKFTVSPGDWTALLTTENEGNHVLTLLRISPHADQVELEESRNRDEAESRRYAVEMRILRYAGSLDPKRLDVLRANSATKTSNESVLRLVDGVVPLKWRPVNLKEEDGLSRLDARKSVELVSAPRITLMTKDAMLRRGTSHKMVVTPVSDAHKDDFHSMLMETSEGHDGVLTGEDFLGKGLVADIQEIPYPIVRGQSLEEGRISIEVQSIHEMLTGFLLLVGVEETETAGELEIDLFAHIRTRNHEYRSVSSLEEALEKAIKVTAFRDRAIVSEGQQEIYLASVSNSEHYIILVEANAVPPGGRRAN